MGTENKGFGFRLSEDWMAVAVGLLLVILAWAGIVGNVPWPGSPSFLPQRKLTAPS